MQFDKIFREAESDARTGDFLITLGRALIETVEDMFHFLLAHTLPGIRDTDFDRGSGGRILLGDGKLDGTAIGSKLECIGKEIEQDVLHLVLVETARNLLFRDELVGHAPAGRIFPEGFRHVPRERDDVSRREIERDLVVVDLLQVQDLVDQAEHPLPVLLHQLHLSELVFVFTMLHQ